MTKQEWEMLARPALQYARAAIGQSSFRKKLFVFYFRPLADAPGRLLTASRFTSIRFDRKYGVDYEDVDIVFYSLEHQRETLRELGGFLRRNRKLPVVLFLVAESWVAPTGADRPRAGEDPCRSEAITVQGVSVLERAVNDDGVYHAMIPIRHEGGRIVQTGPLVESPGLFHDKLDWYFALIRGLAVGLPPAALEGVF